MGTHDWKAVYCIGQGEVVGNRRAGAGGMDGSWDLKVEEDSGVEAASGRGECSGVGLDNTHSQ